MDCIIDNDSQKNLIVRSIVDKLKLPIEPHPPHIHWDGRIVVHPQGSHVYTLSFTLGPKFVNTITYDVTNMDCCGLLLDKQYQYDQRAHYESFDKTYILQKDNHKHLIRSTSPQKKNLVLTCKQARKEVNNVVELALMFLKPQLDSSHRIDIIPTNHADIDKLLQSYSDVFQTPSALPPNKPIYHAIDLLPEASFPNAPLYRNYITQCKN